MDTATARHQQFLNLSVELTGFSAFTLQGTGYAEKYFDTAEEIVGTETLNRFLETYHAITEQAGGDGNRRDCLLREKILSSERFGPIARNIMKMWYVSIWFELPRSWHDKYGPLPNDRTFVVATYAYPEGLLGPAVGAHVQGAKAPGYGSWALPPQIVI